MERERVIFSFSISSGWDLEDQKQRPVKQGGPGQQSDLIRQEFNHVWFLSFQLTI